MITEYAQIIEIDTTRVKVAINSSSGCGACAAKSGCGNGILHRWLNPTRIMWIDADTEFCASASLDDAVKIGVDEGAFVRNALSLYLIPIVAFLAGAGLGYQFQGEIASVLGGVLGLIVGAKLVRYLVKRSAYAAGFSPRIVANVPVEFSPASGVSP